MKDDFIDSLGRAIRYSMDTATNLLEQLGAPERLHERLGSENEHADPTRADNHLRLVAADALQDNGRDEEANLLRDLTQHVAVHDGRVVPARLTHEGAAPQRVHHADGAGNVSSFEYFPSDEYMIGSRWGGPPRWVVDHHSFSGDFPDAESHQAAFPHSVPHADFFPGEQLDEVMRVARPEELREEPDPDHPHNKEQA